MQEVTMYSCKDCGTEHRKIRDAFKCEFYHARGNYANSLWDDGMTLEHINLMCGFYWTLREDLKETTKHNCFVISHWQCCSKPAYRIMKIYGNGFVHVRGRGSWSGSYGNDMNVEKLPHPFPPEDFYEHKR